MKLRTFNIQLFEVDASAKPGGMSVVKRGRFIEDGRFYALKFPAKGGSQDAATLSMNREQDSLSRLDHPNIVKLFGIGHDGADRFLVLEWLEESLSERIEAIGPSDWESFYEYVGRPILDAIQYANGRDCIHRDLKPSNVMFTDQKVPKVTDFGIAKMLDDVHLGKTFMDAGSHPWTPAEQDDGIYSETRDVHSWAALCIACLAGRQDFKYVQELREAANNLRAIAPVDLLLKCLSDKPAERPKTTKLLLWDVDDFHRQKAASSSVPRLFGVDISGPAIQKLATLLPDEVNQSARVKMLFTDFEEPSEILKLPEGDLEVTGKLFRLRIAKPISQTPWLIIRDVSASSQLLDYGRSVTLPIRFVERTTGGSADLSVFRANIAFLGSYLDTAMTRADEEQLARDRERFLTMQSDVLAARIRELRDSPTIEYRDGRWVYGDFD